MYHIHVATMGRAHGYSATAAAAYRAAEKIPDQRTGELHDYRRKAGVLHRELVMPPGAPSWANDRSALWNQAEAAERRKNSTVAREFRVALPEAIAAQDRLELARTLARELVERHGCAVDIAVHAPHRKGDQRNHHAHLLCSTRRLGPEGFTEKTRELDGHVQGHDSVAYWRARWAGIQNEKFQALGLEIRVDHRSLEAQGIDRAPTKHLGPTVMAMERRGIETEVSKRIAWEMQVAAQRRLEQAAELGRIRQAEPQISQALVVLDTRLAEALQARERGQSLSELEQRQREAAENWLVYRAEQAWDPEGPEPRLEKGLERSADWALEKGAKEEKGLEHGGIEDDWSI